MARFLRIHDGDNIDCIRMDELPLREPVGDEVRLEVEAFLDRLDLVRVKITAVAYFQQYSATRPLSERQTVAGAGDHLIIIIDAVFEYPIKRQGNGEGSEAVLRHAAYSNLKLNHTRIGKPTQPLKWCKCVFNLAAKVKVDSLK